MREADPIGTGWVSVVSDPEMTRPASLGSSRLALAAVCLLLAGAFAVAACQKKAEATTTGSDPVPGSAQTQEESPAAGAQAPAAQAAPAFHENNFDLEMAAKGPYKSGQAGELEVILVAKGAFHVNDKYPIKLKLQPSSGIKYPAPVVTKDHVTLEHKRAVMKVELTPESAGKLQVSGEFAFSICTDDVCLMEKRTLEQSIDVN
jgi:hypothetical protein